MALSFPRRRRLRTQGEFLRVQRRGKRSSRGSVLLVTDRSAQGACALPRLGLVVSRKVGIAVRRNAFKRWVREWFRAHLAQLPRGLDLVVIAKAGAVERGHGAICAELDALVRALPKALVPAPGFDLALARKVPAP